MKIPQLDAVTDALSKLSQLGGIFVSSSGTASGTPPGSVQTVRNGREP